jgi:hypothetical protein
MSKINLKSIQNNGKNRVNKQVKNSNNKILTKYSENSNKPQNIVIKLAYLIISNKVKQEINQNA